MTKYSRVSDNGFQEQNGSFTDMVAIYDQAETWQTKRQILSIIANKMPKQDLLNLIPGLTKWRINEARKHAQDFKKECQLLTRN